MCGTLHVGTVISKDPDLLSERLILRAGFDAPESSLCLKVACRACQTVARQPHKFRAQQQFQQLGATCRVEHSGIDACLRNVSMGVVNGQHRADFDSLEAWVLAGGLLRLPDSRREF